MGDMGSLSFFWLGTTLRDDMVCGGGGGEGQGGGAEAQRDRRWAGGTAEGAWGGGFA